MWSVQRYTQSPRAKKGALVNAIDVPSLTFYGLFLFKERDFMHVICHVCFLLPQGSESPSRWSSASLTDDDTQN